MGEDRRPNRRIVIVGTGALLGATCTVLGGVPPSQNVEIRKILERYARRLIADHVLIHQVLNPDLPLDAVPWGNPENAVYPDDQGLFPLLRRAEFNLKD